MMFDEVVVVPGGSWTMFRVELLIEFGGVFQSEVSGRPGS